jgi:hypothetical protein
VKAETPSKFAAYLRSLEERIAIVRADLRLDNEVRSQIVAKLTHERDQAIEIEGRLVALEAYACQQTMSPISANVIIQLG